MFKRRERGHVWRVPVTDVGTTRTLNTTSLPERGHDFWRFNETTKLTVTYNQNRLTCTFWQEYKKPRIRNVQSTLSLRLDFDKVWFLLKPKTNRKPSESQYHSFLEKTLGLYTEDLDRDGEYHHLVRRTSQS